MFYSMEEYQNNRKMTHQILILYSVCLLACQISPLTLGNNLIINSDFSTPNTLLSYQSFPSIPGWNCSAGVCQIQNCSLLNLNCSGQAIDISTSSISNISQQFSSSSGAHLFQLEFLLPIWNSNQKNLLAYFNQELVLDYSSLVQTDNLLYKVRKNIYPLDGVNNLRFTMSGLDDNLGYKLVSVSIQRVIDANQQQIISAFLDNWILKALIASPGSRVLLGEIANTFISFDRLQLYRFHNRNYSYYMNLFIDSVSDILDSKGQLSLSLQKRLFKDIAQKEQSQIQNLDYKSREAINPHLDSFSFISNNQNLIVYSLPYFILIVALMNVMFKATFKYKISKYFRKYSFASIIFLVIVFEGNIEQFSFYILGELISLFSIGFKHKVVNCFILFFFFLTIFCSTAFYLWCWSHHKKKTWCLIDNRLNFNGVVCYSIDRGIICLLFGAAHSLLIHCQNSQLLVLGLCEILWMLTQTMGLKSFIYKCQLLSWLNIIQGILRLTFILSNYLYSQSGQLPLCSSFINQKIHIRQIFLFIGIWVLQLIICLAILVKEGINLLSSAIKDKRIKKKQLKRKRNKQKCQISITVKINLRQNQKQCIYFFGSKNHQHTTSQKNKGK